jgi:hypothetical protein
VQIETSDARRYFIPTRPSRDPLGDHDGDKVMRLFAQTATIENGFVHLPEAPLGCPIISPNSCCSKRPLRRPGRFHRPSAGLGQAVPGRARNVRMLAAAGGRGRGIALGNATKQVSRLPPVIARSPCDEAIQGRRQRAAPGGRRRSAVAPGLIPSRGRNDGIGVVSSVRIGPKPIAHAKSA